MCRDRTLRRSASAWPSRLSPLLELQRTLLSEMENVYAGARAAASTHGEASASSAAVAGVAAAATYTCHVCSLLSHR